MKKKTVLKTLLAVGSLIVAFGLAELIYRAVRPASEAVADWAFVDAAGNELDKNSIADLSKILYLVDGQGGLPKGVKPVPVPPAKRSKPPHAWRPNAHFYLRYTGPQQPYFDEGRVEYRFNSVGIREEDDLTHEPKPEGQYRVLCQGDSFTLGWGVRAEDNWTTLVEQELQKTHPELRTVNTGMAGQSYADEYWFALRDRLHRLQPDMVLVSLCLNDLIITNGKLGHYRDAALADKERDPDDFAWWEASTILRDFARAAGPAPLDLDPEHDYVSELLNLPADHVAYTNKNEGPDLYWASGTPQKSLRAMRDWCRQRDIPFGVVLWPLFQGLQQEQFYPFESLHQMVLSFCEDEGIKVQDLLPAFRGRNPEDLWVSPCDMHGNATAMVVASPPIAAFVRALGGLEGK